ncbi:MAG: choice-of-anchor D domain-containing protein [Verrucomicrobiales bacterium]
MNSKKFFTITTSLITALVVGYVITSEQRESRASTVASPSRTAESAEIAPQPEPVRNVEIVAAPLPIEPAAASHGHCKSCPSCAQAAGKEAERAGVVGQAKETLVRQIVLTEEDLAAIFSGGKGTKVSIPLPGGLQLEGVVDFGRQENGEWVSITGKAESPHQGLFYFVRNQTPGVAGELSGFVRFDEANLAYSVDSSNPEAGMLLVEKDPDEVFCRGKMGMPVAKGVPLASPPVGQADPPVIIKLQSRPGARGVIYLDFDGETGPFPGWGDFDAKPSNVNDASVTEVWKGVVEDFAPFNVNVTTDLAVYQAAPRTSRIQVMITPTIDAAPGAGGVAYLNSFNWDDDKKVCWCFYAFGKSAVEVISHEVGHTFGLRHDGRSNPVEEYYTGQGDGAVGWAPIMGAGYYKTVTQWSKGEYKNPSRANEDDLAIIEANNNVDFVTDDHADGLTGATVIRITTGLGAESFSLAGVISTAADVDCFLVKMGGGTIQFNANPADKLPNLDILVEICDVGGNRLAFSNPDRLLPAGTSVKLKEGTYLIKVSGVGRGNPLADGYTDYGSLGQYTLTGIAPRPPQALDDHGNTFVTATTVTPPQSVGGVLEISGDVDTFSFTVPTAAVYVITSSGTTDVRATLFNSQSISLGSDDDSGGNRNFRIRRLLSPGVHFLQVRAGVGSQTGPYSVNIAAETADGPEIAIVGGVGTTILTGDVAPTEQKGNSFGVIAPFTVATRQFSVVNSGKLDLLLNGTPLVKITGAGAPFFTVDAQPTSPVPASGTSNFTIGFRPTKVGTYLATVSIANSDADEGSYTFAIQGTASTGSANFADSVPVGLPSETNDRIGEPGSAKSYRITLTETVTLNVNTTGTMDTVGELYEGTGKFLQRDDDGGEGKNFRISTVLPAGIYFIRVTGRTALTFGDFKLVVGFETLQPEIELVGLSSKIIPSGNTVASAVDGTDFGSVNAISGFVNRTFNIKNTGFAVLNLTGTPAVTLAGDGASHFSVITPPANPVGSGSMSPFIIRYNPAFAGTHLATVSIANNDANENPYTFNIKGVGFGDPDDHEGTFAGATPISFGETVAAKLERVGDTDIFRFQVVQTGVVVVTTTGTTDTSGVLYDVNQRVVARDEDGGEGPNFRIATGLRPGIYFIQIRGFGTAAGNYALSTGF